MCSPRLLATNLPLLTFPACSGAPVFVLGAVRQPLLDRFVSDYESEPLRCSRLFCPLHIDAVEGYAVRHGFRAAFFERDEVKLILDPPVVAYGVAGAILEHELRADLRRAAEKQVGGQR